MASYPQNNLYGNVATQQALDLMDRIARRQKDEARFATEDTANAIRGVGATTAQGIAVIPQAYMDASKHRFETEESTARTAAHRAAVEAAAKKAEIDAEENLYQNTPDASGKSPKQKAREAKAVQDQLDIDAAKLKNKLTEAQIGEVNATAYAKKNPTPKEKTQQEKEGAAYAEAAARANAQLNALEVGAGVKQTGKKEYLENLPFVGPMLKANSDKSYDAAQLAFITNIMNQQSDKNISPAMLQLQKEMYFPKVGESDEQIEQKRKLRTQKTRQLLEIAGRTDLIAELDAQEAAEIARYQAEKNKKPGTAVGATPAKPPVEQNGYIYNWNAAKGKYE